MVLRVLIETLMTSSSIIYCAAPGIRRKISAGNHGEIRFPKSSLSSVYQAIYNAWGRYREHRGYSLDALDSLDSLDKL